MSKPRAWWIAVYRQRHTIAIYDTKPGIVPDPITDEIVHVVETKALDDLRAENERLRDALTLIRVSDENRNRLDRVDEETLRKLVLHANAIARAALEVKA